MVITRPNLSFAVQQLSQFMGAPIVTKFGNGYSIFVPKTTSQKRDENSNGTALSTILCAFPISIPIAFLLPRKIYFAHWNKGNDDTYWRRCKLGSRKLTHDSKFDVGKEESPEFSRGCWGGENHWLRRRKVARKARRRKEMLAVKETLGNFLISKNKINTWKHILEA